jgi:hypothetical protein
MVKVPDEKLVWHTKNTVVDPEMLIRVRGATIDSGLPAGTLRP